MQTKEIKSLQNDIVKYALKLQDSKFRKKEKMILLDGEKTILGIVEQNIEFEYLFIKKDNEIKNYKKIKNLIFVNDDILKKISTTKSPSPVVGIIKQFDYDKNIFFKLNKIALIDGIKDAGNLGTIIRSACAFDMDGIILFNDCVDIYNSKTIRAAAQNMFKIPIIQTNELDFIKQLQKTHQSISLVVDSKDSFVDCCFDEKILLILGSEACGISKELLQLNGKKLTIPMNKNVESVNLGVCASVAFALIKFSKNKSLV